MIRAAAGARDNGARPQAPQALAELCQPLSVGADLGPDYLGCLRSLGLKMCCVFLKGPCWFSHEELLSSATKS